MALACPACGTRECATGHARCWPCLNAEIERNTAHKPADGWGEPPDEDIEHGEEQSKPRSDLSRTDEPKFLM